MNTTARIAELNNLETAALANRTRAYKMRAPKFVTTAINNDLWSIREERAQLEQTGDFTIATVNGNTITVIAQVSHIEVAA